MGCSRNEASLQLHTMYAPVRVNGQLTQAEYHTNEVDMVRSRNN